MEQGELQEEGGRGRDGKGGGGGEQGWSKGDWEVRMREGIGESR